MDCLSTCQYVLVFKIQVGLPHLTCQRRLRRLLRDTRQVSGHLAQVTVYEEARGELRYSLYLADHAASVQLKVDASSLGKVLQDCSDETGERQAITSEDASRLLVPITDRLVISPSRTAVSTMGAGRGSGKRKTSSASQGYVLKIRYKVWLAILHRSALQTIELPATNYLCCSTHRITTQPLCFRVAPEGACFVLFAPSLARVMLLPHGSSEEGDFYV